MAQYFAWTTVTAKLLCKDQFSNAYKHLDGHSTKIYKSCIESFIFILVS